MDKYGLVPEPVEGTPWIDDIGEFVDLAAEVDLDIPFEIDKELEEEIDDKNTMF